MVSFVQRVTEDHDYPLQLLLSEFIELLLVNTFTVSKEESRQYMIMIIPFFILVVKERNI